MRISDWSSDVCSSDLTPVPTMSVFERYLTVWVFLCIVVGIALGQFVPDVFQAIGRMEIAQVNLPVGLLIWVMIIPMLLKVDFAALGQVRQHWRGMGVTLFINWRSEEHTSELQSLMRISYAVFCLKKTNEKNKTESRDRI